MTSDEDNYDEDIEEIYAKHAVELDKISSIANIIPLAKSHYVAKMLLLLQAGFLTIAAQEEVDPEIRNNMLKSINNLIGEAKQSSCAVIPGNIFCTQKNITCNSENSDIWKWSAPIDFREIQSPVDYICSIYLQCLSEVPKDSDIPPNSRVVPITININLLAPKDSIQRELSIVAESVYLIRDNLKKRRPELFLPENRKCEIAKTRDVKSQVAEIGECLSILKLSIATGKTTKELAGHQPPDEVILEYYKNDLTVPDQPHCSGKKHQAWQTCRSKSTQKLKKALQYLDSAKKNIFPSLQR